MNERMNKWTNEYMNLKMIGLSNESVNIEFKNDKYRKQWYQWNNEWMNEWMNEWLMNEWMND